MTDIQNCAELIDRTLQRLRNGFEVSISDSGCRIITPFLRRDGDPIEIIVRQMAQGFVVTDDGETVDYLELTGINTRRNQTFDRLIREVTVAHGISLERGALAVYVQDEQEIGDAVLRAIAAANDLGQLELTRRERVPQTFPDLVEGELVGLGLPYEPGVVKQGLVRERSFRFGINASRNVVLEPLTANTPSRAVEVAAVFIVAVLDVWKLEPGLGAVAVVDDRRPIWADRALPDIEGSGLTVVLWSRRHQLLPAAIAEPRRGVSQFS